jgi:hypothetical protein
LGNGHIQNNCHDQRLKTNKIKRTESNTQIPNPKPEAMSKAAPHHQEKKQKRKVIFEPSNSKSAVKKRKHSKPNPDSSGYIPNHPRHAQRKIDNRETGSPSPSVKKKGL